MPEETNITVTLDSQYKKALDWAESARKFSITYLESFGYLSEIRYDVGLHFYVNTIDQAICGVTYTGICAVMFELRKTDSGTEESRTVSDRCVVQNDGTKIKRSNEAVIEVNPESAEQELINQVRMMLHALHTQLQTTEFLELVRIEN